MATFLCLAVIPLSEIPSLSISMTVVLGIRSIQCFRPWKMFFSGTMTGLKALTCMEQRTEITGEIGQKEPLNQEAASGVTLP